MQVIHEESLFKGDIPMIDGDGVSGRTSQGAGLNGGVGVVGGKLDFGGS